MTFDIDQTILLASEIYQNQKNYWVKKLLKMTGETTFLKDNKLNIRCQKHPEVIDFTLPPGLNAKLIRLAKNSDLTLYIILLAGLKNLLYRYIGQEDLVVVSPLYKLNISDETINDFVLIRDHITGDMKFKDLLLDIRTSVLQAYDNQDYPFGELVKKHLDISWGKENKFVSNVVCLLRNIHDGFMNEEIKDKLLFSFHHESGSITGKISFDPLIYTKDDIKQAAKHFIALLTAALEDISRPISKISFLSQEEIKQLMYDFNDTEAWYPKHKTIHGLFAEQVERTPEHTAIVGPSISLGAVHESPPNRLSLHITYKELNQQSHRLALVLKEKGVRPGTIAAVMIERSLEMIIGIFAILKSGGAYLPIHPEYPAERIGYMLTDSNARLLIKKSQTHPGAPNSNDQGKRTTVAVSDFEYLNFEFPIGCPGRRFSNFHRPMWDLTAANLIYVIYTSGSTGRPKGVMVEHMAVINRLYWMQRCYTITEMDVILQKTPVVFDVSVWELFWWCWNGASLCLLGIDEEKDPQAIADAVEKNRITTIHFVPSMLTAFLDYCQQLTLVKKLSALKQVFSSGEALGVHHVQKFNQLLHNNLGTRLINLYGPTEATVDVSYYNCPPGVNIQQVPIGKPIDNIKLFIISENLELQPIGVKGELCIAGHGLARGYLNKPEMTAEKFKRTVIRPSKRFSKVPNDQCPMTNDRLYKTGDMARWLPDGNIQFLGRIDHQVKIRGYRLELGEIDNLLLNHPGIKDALVTIREDAQGEKYLCAYFVSREASHMSTSNTELEEYLQQVLPHYMVPLFFVPLQEIPLKSNGKVDREALPEPGAGYGSPDENEPYTMPANKLEKELAKIWSDLLGIPNEKISRYANFFKLGGQSLKATSMMSRLKRSFNIHLSLNKIFKNPILHELSHEIKNAQKMIYKDIKPVEKKEYYELSSAQKRLYFLDRFKEIGTSYNITAAYKINGKIDKEQYERIFKTLITRHQALRTSFHVIDNKPFQKVHEITGVNFEMENLKIIDSGIKEGNIAAVIKKFIRPFDLDKAPLLRAAMVILSTGEHLLLFDMHHIIGDGTSVGVLIDEFTSLFADEELTPLKIQYKDFSTWQNKLIEIGSIHQQEDFWLNLYSGEIPVLNLSTDYPRPDVFNFKGDTYTFQLAPADTLQFKSVAAQNQATLFMNLLAVFNVLLHKYSGQEDIIIGSSIDGRPRTELQQIMGMFVNELAILNHPNGEKTYHHFLSQVKENSLNCFDNQDVQFEELVGKLNLQRNPSRNPLFDICIVVQNFEQPRKEIKGVTFSPYVYENKTTKFDITLFVSKVGDAIYFTIEYYTEIFKKETIQRLASNFIRIINTVNKNPHIKISALDILAPEEKQLILSKLNNTLDPYPQDKTIHQLFSEQADKTPGHIALIFKHHLMTYSELEKKSNQLARYLVDKKNILPEDRVGILMNNSIDMVVAILGVLKSGGAYVPLAPGFPGERINTIINDAGIKVILSAKKFIKTLNHLQWETRSAHTFLCMDSRDIYEEDEMQKSELMEAKLWNYVAESAGDEITGGGWISSYTGEPFGKKEMEEYGDNILQKLKPLLHHNLRVLEIGCASGITMYRIAPEVGFYYGTDLSDVSITKNQEKVNAEGYQNIKLDCLPAHQLEKIRCRDFDLVIINSKVQSFHGHNYLRKVIRKCIDKLAPTGFIFIGDIMDLDLKPALIKEMVEFNQIHKDKNVKTKIDWSTELFLSRSFLKNLPVEIPGIEKITFSHKIYTIENELTKFRYDALLTINKKWKSKKINKRKYEYKYQEDIKALEKCSGKKLAPRGAAGNTAYIIYTSGTTGTPKGVMIEHQSLVNYCWWGVTKYIKKKNVRFPLYTTFSFDLTISSIYLPLISGNSIVIYDDSENRLTIRDVIQEDMVDIIKATPSHLKVIQSISSHINKDPITRPKTFILGGEALTGQLAQNLYTFFPGSMDIYNEYGPTEATVGCIFHRFDARQDKQGNVPIGLPINNVMIYILDKYLKLVPINTIGEIYISGTALARGYINKPGLTAEKFLQHPISFTPGQRLYQTGDLGRLLNSGNIEFIGRTDQQVKIRGYRIEIKEIENQLLKHHDVKDAVVTVKKNQKNEAYLCAYFVTEYYHPDYSLNSGLDVNRLREFLLNKLPDYMVPFHFVPLERIPLTSQGKINIHALPEPGIEEKENYAPPRDHLEQKMVEVWQEILEIDTIGIDDNFFQLGMDSIKAIQISSRLAGYRLQVDMGDLFLNHTIRELRNYIKPMDAPSQETVVGETALTPKQKWFFENISTDKHYYNMALMLYNREEFNQTTVEKVFKKIMQHHDAMRILYNIKEDHVIQEIQGASEKNGKLFDLEFVDLRGTKDFKSKAEETAHWLQGGMNLETGPLVRLGLFKTDQGDHLLISIHHLVIDGISWRILLEDFALGYQQAINQEEIKFQDKTDSFKQWTQELAKYSNSEKALEELEYWQQVLEAETETLPVDFHITAEKKVFKNVQKERMFLNKDRTEMLIKKIHQVYHTEINDILLTALGMALHDWAGMEKTLITLEGHGREGIIEGINISRTIGWFTSEFPVLLNMKPAISLSQQIIEVKDMLRNIPNKGIGYGILTYLTPPDKKKGVRLKGEPLIKFNYMGQFEEKTFQNDAFEMSPFNTGEIISPNLTRNFSLEINSRTANGIFFLSIYYNTCEFKAPTIQRLVNLYQENLIKIINHCTPLIQPEDAREKKGDT